jgi:hypothetical protein
VRGTFNYAVIDAFVASDVAHPGSFPIYTDRYVPIWANGTGNLFTPPTDINTYANCQNVLSGVNTTNCQYKEAVTAIMRHVCGVSAAPSSPLIGACTLKVFEGWNEWNVGNYWGGTYVQLAKMLEDKAAIIRLYCGDCTIIGGSVSAGGDGSGGSWITALETGLADWGAIVPVISTTFSSNANSTGIVVTPVGKQLTNCITDYSGGVPQPAGVPVGQLYCTTAAKTLAMSRTPPGPNLGVVVATNSGVGIAPVNNGLGAGGTDSPATLSDTYGGTADDGICTGDPNRNLPTIVPGLAPSPCKPSSSAVFGVSTAAGFPNADVLWPRDYPTVSADLDNARFYYRDFYFMIPNVATIHNLEADVNYNCSAAAYAAGECAYTGWGFQYNGASHTLQYCGQNCLSWQDFRGIDVTATHPDLTTFTAISGHWYHIRQYGHRNPGCTFTSPTNCAFYDALSLNDVTAGATPITYRLVDAVTGLAAGFIPVDNHTYAAGPDIQVQIDETTAPTSGTAHIESDTTVFYSLPHLPDAVSWHAYPARTTITFPATAPFPEDLVAHGSGTCTGAPNSSCRTAIKDQVATLYSPAILGNPAIASWASALPVWQTEGGFGINSAMTDGVSDTSANTKFLRAAYTSRHMIALAATPASGSKPVHSLWYSWQDRCWGTQFGDGINGGCTPPTSTIPSGPTSVNAAFIQTKAWLSAASFIGPMVSTAVTGGNIYTVDLVASGSPQRLAWFTGWLGNAPYATTFTQQQSLAGTITTVSGTATLSNQPVLLSVGATFTLSNSVTGSGTVTGCAGTLSSGSAYGCTVTPAPGYFTTSVTGCSGALSGGNYSGIMPASNCTVAATFAVTPPPSFNISASITGAGSVAGCVGSHVGGTAYACTLTPGIGYAVSTATGCGGTLVGATYNGTMPANDCTVTATFIPITPPPPVGDGVTITGPVTITGGGVKIQ